MRLIVVAVLGAAICAAACSTTPSRSTTAGESADIQTTTDTGGTALATSFATTFGTMTTTVDTTLSTTADSTSGSGSGSTLDPSSPIARYRLTIANTWSERTHPGLVPDLAHFSWLAGATHDSAFTFWSLGALASPGVVQMAETGVTDVLVDEVMAAIDGGHVGAALSWQHWFCPPATATTECGASVEFEVTLAHPRVSLASMLGPSPDLFIGVSSLPLLQDDQWIEHLELELFPYDGGTRSDHDFTMNGALQEPPLPITLITSTDEHILGPGSLGTITFERVG